MYCLHNLLPGGTVSMRTCCTHCASARRVDAHSTAQLATAGGAAGGSMLNLRTEKAQDPSSPFSNVSSMEPVTSRAEGVHALMSRRWLTAWTGRLPSTSWTLQVRCRVPLIIGIWTLKKALMASRPANSPLGLMSLPLGVNREAAPSASAAMIVIDGLLQP